MTQITTTTRTFNVKEDFETVLNLIVLNGFGEMIVTEVQKFCGTNISKVHTREFTVWLQKSHIVEVKKFKS